MHQYVEGSHHAQPGRSDFGQRRTMAEKKRTWESALTNPRTPIWERIQAAQVLGHPDVGWTIVREYIRNAAIPPEERICFAQTIGYVVKRKPREIILRFQRGTTRDRHVVKVVVH